MSEPSYELSKPTALSLRAHRLWVEPAWEGVAREVLAAHLRAPEEVSGAAVVKQNRIRTVARVPTEQGALFCKRFQVRGLFDRLVHLFKASSARREWTALRRFAAAGIPVPRAVLLAEERGGLGLLVGSNLATVEVASTRELPRLIDELRAAEDRERRPRLLAALARSVREIFRAGGDHPDLHLANFLARAESDDELVALDLHSVRLRRAALPASRRRLRLAKVAHSFGLFDPDTAEEGARELEWFCAAYVGLDDELGSAEALALDLPRRARRLELRRVGSRDRRCLVDSTSFKVERRGGALIYRRSEVPRELLLAAIESPEEAVIHEHPKGRSRIVKVARPAGFPGEGPLLVKHYPLASLRRRLAAISRPVSLLAWKAARACEVSFVPHPRHYGLVRWGRLVPQRAAIVMDLIPDVTMIHVLFQEEGWPSAAARRRLARDFGRVMGRFHGAGLRHRDLAVQNILVRPKQDPAREGCKAEGWDVWVIDLDEVARQPMSRAAKLRALVHLGDLPAQATRTDRLRFWRAYREAGGGEVFAAELRAWGERGLGQRVGAGLAARAERKARRMARRGHARPPQTNIAALETEESP